MLRQLVDIGVQTTLKLELEHLNQRIEKSYQTINFEYLQVF